MAPSPPPPSNGELLQHGLHHLVQHNLTTSYPYEQQYDEAVHMQSAYGSPGPQDEVYAYRNAQPRYTYQHQHQDSGLGIQYDGYVQEYQASMYQDRYSSPATSPPTPSMNDVLRTRNGTVYQRGHQNLRPMPEGRSRVEKSPKPKKPKREKGVKAEKKVAKLDRPLSELTKDWTHVPVVDIEAYVNRSAEERRREVEEGKNPGKVKRPMNSFMLYRKAYQNRTKDWCLQNNHQVVSQVCGDSWPLEPDEVKEQFTEWAKIERQNHQNAHPGYKFSPTKPGIAKNSKRKMSEDIISEESDLDDFEWQSSSTRRVKKHKHVPSPRMDQQVQYPTRRSAYQYSSREHSIEPNHVPYNRSSYQATNPGRPLPTQYSQGNLRAGEYYQQATHNHPSMHGVQDIIIKKAVAPGMQYLGLPGSQESYDLMNNFPQYEGHGISEHRIDPSLDPHDQASIYDANGFVDPMSQNLYFAGGQNGEQRWEGRYTANDHDPAMPFIDPDLHHDGAQIQDPHMHVLKGHQDGWNVVETLDAGGEFDKWMDEV